MWSVLSTAGSGARAWNQVAWDGARVIVAGGADGGGTYKNDFATFENDTWTQRIPYVPTAEPVSREHQAVVYCPVDGKTWFFNGHTGTSANSWATWDQRYRIWKTDGTAWEDTGGVAKQPEPGTDWNGNPMRMSAGTIWCPQMDGFLILGGANWYPDRTYLLRRSDAKMERVLTTNSFAPGGMRFNVNNQAVWISELNKAALFGGQDTTTNGKTYNELKVFDPATLTWANQPTINPPPGRSEAAVVYRPGKIAVYGGINRETSGGTTTKLADFWELDIPTWTWTQLPDAPQNAWFHGGAWDGTRYIFCAGFSDSGNGKTLTYTPSAVPGVQIETPVSLIAEAIDA